MRRTVLFAVAVAVAACLALGACRGGMAQEDAGRGTPAVRRPAGPAAGPAEAPAAASAPDLVAESRKGVRIKRLDNGLVVMTKENHAAPVASVYVVVRAGSLFEQEYLGAGISHLAEHLVAGGSTASRTEEQVQKVYEDIGAESNAFTGSDRTTYFISTVPSHVGTAIDLLADAMMNSAVPQAEFDRELGVVQREILNGAAEPNRQAAYLLNETMFPHMPQGMRTIGYHENIQKLTRQDVLDYYRRTYVPSNAAVCAAGDFDGAQVLQKLEAAFGKWAGPQVRPTVLPEASPPVSDLLAVKEMDARLATGVVAYHSCRLSSPDLYPLDVLAGILGDGDSSRLGADLKVKRSLVYAVRSWNHTPTWPGGTFAVNFTCDAEKLDEVRRAVADHIAALYAAAPSREEVEKVKKQVVAEHVMESRTAASQAYALASDQLQLGDPFFSARYVQNIQAVQPDDILRVARKYLHGTRSITAIVRPKAAAAEAAAETPQDLAATTTRIKFPQNDLTLLVYRTPGQPAVSMIAAMRAGQTVETPDNAGISSLAARYLTRGTDRMSEEAVAEFFDSIGGSIKAASGWNSIYVESLVLKEDFPEAVKVFADVVARPAFPPKLLASTQQRQLAALKAAQGDAAGQCALFLDEQFFTESPYRFPSTGTEETIKALTAEAVRDFYRRHAVGRNMVVIVAGDVEPAGVEELVRARFSGLPPGEKVEPPPSAPSRRVDQAEIHVKTVDKPGCVVMAAYPGTDLYNLRDRFAMDVFDTIISGYSTPRGPLHDVLRGRSLVYAVHFGGRLGLLPGYYRSYALCQPEKATLVARLLVDLVHSGRDLKYSDDDLRRAKSTILTARQMDRQTPEQVALMMALDELYGLGYDFEKEYVRRLEAVTPADVARVARDYITRPVLCITTPRPELLDKAELLRPYDPKKLQEMKAAAPEPPPTD